MRNPPHRIQNLIKVRVYSSTLQGELKHRHTQNNLEIEVNPSQCYPTPMNYIPKANLVE